MEPTVITAVVGAGAAGTTGITVGWIARTLLKRYIERNDKKHDATDETLEKINSKLSNISENVAVMSTVLSQVLALKDQVQRDHDKVVAMEAWNKKYSDDLRAQFSKIKVIEDTTNKLCDDIGNFISKSRREANND